MRFEFIKDKNLDGSLTISCVLHKDDISLIGTTACFSCENRHLINIIENMINQLLSKAEQFTKKEQ